MVDSPCEYCPSFYLCDRDDRLGLLQSPSAVLMYYHPRFSEATAIIAQVKELLE